MMATLASTEPGGTPGPRSGPTLDRLATAMFGLLAVEFLLGMALALFVSLPSAGSVVSVLESLPVLDLHIVIAVFLVGISARAVAITSRIPHTSARMASAIALVSSVLATAAGWGFTFDGQSSTASFVMALGFLGVLLGAFLLRGGRSTGDVPPTPNSPGVPPFPSREADR